MKKYFSFHQHHATYRQELLGALTTFATMAYVIIINPTILSETGINFGAVMTATIIITFLACSYMGIFARYPIALAPGMGTSAYFTYSIVLKEGFSWQEALGCVFLAACCIFIISIFRLREKILRSLPKALTYSSAAGIGLFIMVVGLQQAGILTYEKHSLGIGRVNTLPALFTFLSLVLILICMRFKIRGFFILAILFSWILSLIFHLTKWKGFVALPPSLSPTFFQLDVSRIFSMELIPITLSLFLVSLFDSSASLLTLFRILQRKGIKIDRMHQAVIPDGLFTIIGTFLGTASLAYHLESASGIKTGAKTGLCAVIVGILFLCCLFFYPIISSIPHFASASVLIVLGMFMLVEIKEICWKDITEVIPALITALTMPLTFSIYKGFAFGFISYTLIKVLWGRYKEVHYLVAILSVIFLAQLFFL